ncbi:PAS domain-containing protein [Vibrio sp. M260118]|uniref:PAS domain-containing protein n=1 Tax=Vibrio sp. M260118 TaxID=3020896 RepID=UPI002F3EFFEB
MNNEITIPKDSFIVSKTDTQGKIKYANRMFMRVSNFSEEQLLGKNHNIIRHADMPRGVFYGLWSTLKREEEFFGFVKNSTADGDYYWVFANITPDYENGKLIGYYSVRRPAPERAKQQILAVYADMLKMESNAERSQAPEASWNKMVAWVEEQHGLSYPEFMIHLYNSCMES